MSNSVGRVDNLLATAKRLSVLPNTLNIFDIRQRYTYSILCLLEFERWHD